MRFEVGKYYRTRDGRKAYIACEIPTRLDMGQALRDGFKFCAFVDGVSDFFVLKENGMAVGGYSNYDLIEEWVEPKRINGWVNVYKDGLMSIPTDRATADANATSGRIACIQIDVTEGDGLNK